MMNREKAGLVLLRIFLGVWFLWSGIPKMKAAYFQEEMAGLLSYFAEQGAMPFYKPFLLWATGHAKIFAFLTAGGEVLIGGALVLGFLIPVTSVTMIVMCLNYFFATKNLGPAPIGVNFLCIATGIALIVGQAGRAFGLDSLLCKCKKKAEGTSPWTSK